jgi:hypothetical protein
MRELLLVVHILSVIVWLGCGLYELFLTYELKKARGTNLELDLMRFYLKYSAPVPIATLLVAMTGATMAIVLDWGFFQQFWLGTKQVLMVGVLIIFASVLPPFIKLGGIVKSLPADVTALPEEAAVLFDRIEPWLVVMRIMGALAVFFAVFKFG